MRVIASSISLKLSLIFGAILAAAIIAMTLFATFSVRRLAVENFNAASLGEMRQIDGSLQNSFKQVSDNVRFLSASPAVQSANASITTYLTSGGVMTPDKNGGEEAEIYSLLKQFGDSRSDLRFVYLGTKWGGYVQWPTAEFKTQYDPRTRPWFQRGTQAKGDVRRTGAYRSASDNELIISFVRSFENKQGEPTGVLGMDVSMGGLAKTVAQARFGKSGYLIVVEDSGKVLADAHDASHDFKALKDLGAGYRDLADFDNGSKAIELNGTSFDSVVYTSPELGWKYIGLIPHAEMIEAANRLTIGLVLGGALLTLIALAFTIVVGRRLTAPLRQLSDSMRDVASGDGDLTRRLPVTSTDEVGVLAGHFNAFVNKLNHVLLDIRSSSEALRLASGEISAGNADLSQRTERQAAALEQTAASMEQLTSAVKQNADNARQANLLALDATDVARRSNEVVERVVSTMSEINDSSSQIAEITALIEGIAFQTNILALNAAVEAARAGEQGRGFAVVAGEVRSLAQRSSVAAKDIKELIGASVSKIQDGSVLASEAGRTMSGVTCAVQKVAGIMNEIASASDEQSRGIEQVNLAISQMDDVTQQNAALVEEAAGASLSLEEQGRQLNDVVASFRLQQ